MPVCTECVHYTSPFLCRGKVRQRQTEDNHPVDGRTTVQTRRLAWLPARWLTSDLLQQRRLFDSSLRSLVQKLRKTADSTDGRDHLEESANTSTQPVGLDRPISDGDRHSHTSTVRTWTKDDVTKWLTTNDLVRKYRVRYDSDNWTGCGQIKLVILFICLRLAITWNK